jgi:hypothetical protein
MEELERARALGEAAAEGWFQGLSDIGTSRIKDAARWENWEFRGGFESLNISPLPGIDRVSFPSGQHPIPQASTSTPTPTPMYPLPAASPSNSGIPSSLPPRPNVVPPNPGPGPHQAHTRGPQNFQNVTQAKAARKAEIERRCQSLNPPIPPNLLRHMESFNAACQIAAPFTDAAWEMLMPRLQAQLSAAQKTEEDVVQQLAMQQAQLDLRRQQDATNKEAKEALDKEYEESQKPIRDLLSKYADESIRRDWAEGKMVNHEQAPRFAAEVLIYVRERFYSAVNPENQNGSAEDAILNDLPTKTLNLEHMKWVFDNKIKPVTEPHRKDVFLCSGQGCQGNSKFYGFEGVIQHYGAKHTTTFSQGNIVVHWRTAEWPEDPPFNPEPQNARIGYYGPSGSRPRGQSNYGQNYGGYSRGMTTTPQMPTLGPSPMQASPGPYGQAPFANGPFAPPQGPPTGPQHGYQPHGYQGPSGPFYSPQQPGYARGPEYEQFFYPGGNMPPYNGHPTAGYQPYPQEYPPHTGMGYPPGQPQHQPQPYPPSGQHYPPGTMDPVSSSTPIPAPTAAPMADPQYDDRKSEVAQVARKIFTALKDVNECSTSVRIQVIVHHVVSKFKARFFEEPSLDLFADALASHHLMRSIRAVSGLSCRACTFEQSTLSPSSETTGRKQYDFAGLVSHFKSNHVRRAQATPGSDQGQLDWKVDMVSLPEDEEISGLIRAPGMNDEKLRMVADCFPLLFPNPLPHIGTIKQPTPPQSTSVGPLNGTLAPQSTGCSERFPITQTDSKSNGTPVRTLSQQGYSPGEIDRQRQSSQSLPPAPEDEYDPRRPAIELRYTYSRERRDAHPRPRDMVYYRPAPRGGYYVRGIFFSRCCGSRVDSNHDDNQVTKPYEEYYVPASHTQYRPRSPYAQYIPLPENSSRPAAGRPAQPDDAASDPASVGGPSGREESYQPEEESSRNPAAPQKTNVDQPPSPVAPQATNPSDAAERFLTNFLGGDSMEEYKRKAAENDRQREEASRTQPEADGAPQFETRIPSADVPPNGQLGRPAYEGPPSRNEDQYLRQPPPKEYYVGPVSPRYHDQVSFYREDQYASGQRIVRAGSRYPRYEAQRRRFERERSRSPRSGRDSAGPGPAPEPRYMPSRSPDHGREYVPAPDEPEFAPGPRVVYRYANAPPPRRYDDYEPVEYVRVRESYPRYVQGPPPDEMDYVPVERSRREPPMYDERRVMYIPYEQGPPAERRVYEEPPPGGGEVRYVEHR